MQYQEGQLVKVVKPIKTISGFPTIPVGTLGRLGPFQRNEGPYEIFQFYPLAEDGKTVLPGAYAVCAVLHVVNFW